MISKELLSVVLGNEVRVVVHWDESVVQWNEHRNLPHTLEEINIHELAHKCKKWVLIYKYEILSGYLSGRGYVVAGDQRRTWFADTECEAIFKACEYIMEHNK